MVVSSEIKNTAFKNNIPACCFREAILPHNPAVREINIGLIKTSRIRQAKDTRWKIGGLDAVFHHVCYDLLPGNTGRFISNKEALHFSNGSRWIQTLLVKCNIIWINSTQYKLDIRKDEYWSVHTSVICISLTGSTAPTSV